MVNVHEKDVLMRIAMTRMRTDTVCRIAALDRYLGRVGVVHLVQTLRHIDRPLSTNGRTSVSLKNRLMAATRETDLGKVVPAR